MAYNLTTNQEEITDSILANLINPHGPREMLLKGYAGTGKTFITKVITQRLRVPFYVSAPIHKAVGIISKVTNAKGLTLHSFHGLRLNMNLEDFDINNPKFDPLGDPKCDRCRVLIVDEASQVSSGIYELNKARAKQFGYKVLYIGDEGQLPPSRETVSRVFKIEKQFELTEVMRQEDTNQLLHLFKFMRYDLKYNTSTAIDYMIKNRDNTSSDGTGFTLLKSDDYAKAGYNQFTRANLANPDHIRNISYTNGAVKTWNTIFRNNMLGGNAPLVHEDDVFTAYITIVDEFNDIVIANSSDYKVYQYRDYVDDYGLKTFAVNFVEVGNVFPTKTLQIVDHTDADTFKRYKGIVTYLLKNAENASATEKGKQFKKYFNFIHSHLCMVDYTIHINGYDKDIRKTIDYAYGITAHKAQGSTYNKVAVDLMDIMYYYKYKKYNSYSNIALRNKLLYVALSRAQTSAIIHYNL